MTAYMHVCVGWARVNVSVHQLHKTGSSQPYMCWLERLGCLHFIGLFITRLPWFPLAQLVWLSEETAFDLVKPCLGQRTHTHTHKKNSFSEGSLLGLFKNIKCSQCNPASIGKEPQHVSSMFRHTTQACLLGCLHSGEYNSSLLDGLCGYQIYGSGAQLIHPSLPPEQIKRLENTQLFKMCL